jgi:hypothetical protein
MKNIFAKLILVFLISVLTGCAHSIRITPEKLPEATGTQRAPIAVGYFISEENRKRRVVTGGGGGDSVEYAPYAELESGLFRVLNNLFDNVHLLKSAEDKVVIADKKIRFVFKPTITTTSSSSSLVTWPPTSFEINLDVNAVDADGKTVWTERVTGRGAADFSEFKSDFSLAGKRASEAVLNNLQNAIKASPLTK